MEIILLFLIIVGMIILQTPAREWFEKMNERASVQTVPFSHETFYHSVISKHFKYYNRLGLAEQKKFLFRTYLFKKSKKFHYIEVTES